MKFKCGKRFFVLLLSMCLFSSAIEVMAANEPKAATGKVKSLKYKNKSDLKETNYDKIILKDDIVTPKLKKGCVVVNMKLVCDQTYQKAYKKDWAARARKTVYQAGIDINVNFNIFYNIRKAVSWKSSKSSDAETLLYELRDSNYLTNESKDDMVIGFTKKASGNTLGIGFIGAPYSLVCSTVYNTDIQTAQHEGGHNYDLNHCNNPKCCLYPYSDIDNIGRFCSPHKSQWKQNRKMY